MDKHYQFTYKGIKLDPYRILKVYGISDPAQQHAIKKLLRAGESVKPLKEDIKEVILSLTRWLEMLEEDENEDLFSQEFSGYLAERLKDLAEERKTSSKESEETLYEEKHPRILSIKEALKALRDGHKLFCKDWNDDAFIFMKEGKIFDEIDKEYSDGEFNSILIEHDLYLKGRKDKI